MSQLFKIIFLKINNMRKCLNVKKTGHEIIYKNGLVFHKKSFTQHMHGKRWRSLKT